jgi:hypothetical protein
MTRSSPIAATLAGECACAEALPFSRVRASCHRSRAEGARLALLALLLGSLGAAGCGPSGTPVAEDDPTRRNLEAIGDAYVRTTQKLGHPPRDTDKNDFLTVLKMYGDPAKLSRSASDQQEFVIVWGVELRSMKAKGDAIPIVAFEKTGKDGKRYVLRGHGDVILMTDGQLRAAAFPAGYVPSL